MAQLSAALGIDADDDLAAVEKEIVDGPHLPSSEWAAVAAVFQEGSPNDKDQSARLIEALAATDPGCGWTSISASSSPRARAAPVAHHRGPGQGVSRLWRIGSSPRRRASKLLVDAPQGRRLPRPHRGARHHRARGDHTLRRREGPPRAPRLRRPHRQGRRDAGAGQSELGALQARSRARPRPDRRGAGYEREAVADRAATWCRNLRPARGRAAFSPAPCSRSATRSSRSSRSRGRRRANMRRCEGISRRCSARPKRFGGMCGSTTRSARGRTCSARSTRCSAPPRSIAASPPMQPACRGIWRCRRRCRASSRSGR